MAKKGFGGRVVIEIARKGMNVRVINIVFTVIGRCTLRTLEKVANHRTNM